MLRSAWTSSAPEPGARARTALVESDTTSSRRRSEHRSAASSQHGHFPEAPDSLAGIPGTVGFIAKFTIFAAAVNADVIWLTILGLLMSVVSVYYYLRLPVLMYMREPSEDAPRREVASGEALVLSICALAVVFLGFFPNWGTLPIFGDVHALDWARDSVTQLLSSGLS